MLDHHAAAVFIFYYMRQQNWFYCNSLAV